VQPRERGERGRIVGPRGDGLTQALLGRLVISVPLIPEPEVVQGVPVPGLELDRLEILRLLFGILPLRPEHHPERVVPLGVLLVERDRSPESLLGAAEVSLAEQERSEIVVQVGIGVVLGERFAVELGRAREVALLLVDEGEVRVGAHEEGVGVDRLAVVRLRLGGSLRRLKTLPRLLNPSA
jgi:hypothetical protein